MYISYGVFRAPVWFVNGDSTLDIDPGFIEFIVENPHLLTGSIHEVYKNCIILEYDCFDAEYFYEDIDIIIELSAHYNG